MLQSIKYTIIFINVLLYTKDAALFVRATIFCCLFMCVCFSSLFRRESAVEGNWFVVGTVVGTGEVISTCRRRCVALSCLHVILLI
jgi:hypothetical protein